MWWPRFHWSFLAMQPPCWTERAAGLLTAGKGHHHYAKTLLYACVYYVYMYHNPIDHNMFYRNMVHIHMRITKFLHSAWPSVPDLASVIQACYTQCIPGHHSLLTKPLSLVAVKVLSKDHATHDKSSRWHWLHETCMANFFIRGVLFFAVNLEVSQV